MPLGQLGQLSAQLFGPGVDLGQAAGDLPQSAMPGFLLAEETLPFPREHSELGVRLLL